MERALCTVWSSHTQSALPTREWSLPTGQTHVVLRLAETPVHIFESLDDVKGARHSSMVVGGMRERSWLRVPTTAPVLGFQLEPAACEAVLGVPAIELSGRHSNLEDVVPWARSVRETLCELPSSERVPYLRAFLAARTRRERLDDLVDFVLRGLQRGERVKALVQQTGRSHRTVLTRFVNAVGLSPARFAGLLRFQRAVKGVSAGGAACDVALAAGYADQSHFAREFRARAQLTVTQFRGRHVPATPNHVRA